MVNVNKIPRIKRARGVYLYDEKGNRYLDLYLDGGRAFCGHRPNGLSNTIKNAVSRGIFAPYPSVYEERLFKVLKQGFPRYSHQGVYRSLESFIKDYGKEISFADPAKGDSDTKIMRWRPGLPLPEKNELLLIILPYPGVDAVAVLSKEKPLPNSHLLSPVLSAGLVRSWFDLQEVLGNLDQEQWTVLDKTGHWKRRGPYLEPLCSREEYDNLFALYLEADIVISPDYDCPSLCIAPVKEGSLKKLYRILGEG